LLIEIEIAIGFGFDPDFDPDSDGDRTGLNPRCLGAQRLKELTTDSCFPLVSLFSRKLLLTSSRFRPLYLETLAESAPRRFSPVRVVVYSLKHWDCGRFPG